MFFWRNNWMRSVIRERVWFVIYVVYHRTDLPVWVSDYSAFPDGVIPCLTGYRHLNYNIALFDPRICGLRSGPDTCKKFIWTDSAGGRVRQDPEISRAVTMVQPCDMSTYVTQLRTFNVVCSWTCKPQYLLAIIIPQTGLRIRRATVNIG